jgi:hypothetical protein
MDNTNTEQATIGDFLRSPDVMSKDAYLELRHSGKLNGKVSFPYGITKASKKEGEQYGRRH